MTFARASCVVAGLGAGFAAALWLGWITLLVNLIDAPTIAHAVAVVATSVVAMLATAIGALMVSDRQADVQCRRNWAPLGLTSAYLIPAVELATASDIDPRYLVPTRDEALRQVFRAYRAAAQVTRRVPAPARSAKLSGLAVPDQVSEAGAALDADTSKHAAPRTLSTRPAAAQTVVRSWKGRHREKVMAGRLRLVANGAAWPDWTARISPSAGRAVEVVVLNASQNDQGQPQREASVGPDGADSTARPACCGPPQVIARRRNATGSATEQRWGGSTNASPDDIIVRDDLGPQILICAAELEVIETYLGHLLDVWLASSTDNPGSDKR